MPSGDLATIYPLRMLIGILSKKMEWLEIKAVLEKLGLIKYFKYGLKEAEISYKLSKKPDTILTSSIGRIMDAFSALLKICFKRTYEGEPAMKLEALASKWDGPTEIFDVKIKNEKDMKIIKTSDMMLEAVERIYQNDKREKVAKSVLATLGYSLAKIAVEEADRRGISKIVVSGGAAVNSILVKSIKDFAREKGLTVLIPNRLPAGDGGVAVGQAIIGAFKNGVEE